MAASQKDLVTWIVQAGWTGPDRVTAVAVAMAAGSNPAAPAGIFGIGGPANDGAGQAAAARQKFTSTGWAGFPGHGNGSWLLYVPIATAAVTAYATGVTVKAASNPGAVAAQAAAQVPGAQQVLSPLQSAGNLLNFLQAQVSWVRISKVTIGIALVAIGAMRLTIRTVKGPGDRAINRTLNNVDVGVEKYLGTAATRAPRPRGSGGAAASGAVTGG